MRLNMTISLQYPIFAKLLGKKHNEHLR